MQEGVAVTMKSRSPFLRSCFELFEMFFEVKEIFIFFPLLQSDSTAIFLGRSGRN